MKQKIIFFDWDGTLASTKISEKANLERSKVLLGEENAEKSLNLMRNNGENHYELIQRILKEITGIEDLNEIKRMQVYMFAFFYLKFFREEPLSYMLADLEKLKYLKAKYNLKFVIITRLFKEIIGGCLKSIDSKKEIFDDYFGVENNLSGEKVDFISSAIAKYPECEPFMMIGDKEDDIYPGKYHGLKTIFCDYGHGKSDGADVSVKNADEMVLSIEKLLNSS